MSKLSNRAAVVGIMGALALGTLGVAPASAQSPRIQKQGKCSATSQWKLKLRQDGGVIETQFEVDTNAAGQKWKVVLKDNGATVFTGARKTVAPSDSFSVSNRIPNLVGVDRVTASATNTVTGEKCFAQASI